MATTTVQGTVSRIYASRGFSLKETWNKRDGGTGTRYWSVFVPDGQPVTAVIDSRVKVSGMLAAEVSSKDARYVDYKVSNATVETIGAPAPAADPVDAWPTEDPNLPF
jgi:hypothetical protein